MKISDVTLYPIMDAGGRALLVVIDTDEGLVGLGEVGNRARQEAARGAVDHFRPLLQGMDPMRTEHIWQLLFRSGFFPGDSTVTSAISAIDIALWDIKGQALGVPIYQLLGGAVRAHVPCYTHIGPDNGDTVALAAHAVAKAGAGWRYLRMAVPVEDGVLEPRRAAGHAIAQFHAVRDAVGDDIELLIDVHTRLDPSSSVMLCREIESARPFFVEDALRSEEPGAYAAFRQRTSVPLAAGEQFGSKWQFRQLIDQNLIDFARFDLCIGGGFTEAVKLAGWCEAHYIDMATHNPLGVVATTASMHFNLACSNFAINELCHAELTEQSYFLGVPEVRDGALHPSDRPGLGIQFDREAAARAVVKRHESPQLRRADGAFTNW